VPLIEASGFAITISSIPNREARKYFTKLERDRSNLRQHTAGSAIAEGNVRFL
jgi:hypothetical protein